MNLKDNILQWRKRRAIRRHDHAAYFKIVRQIARREAGKLIKEKLKK